MSFLKNLARRTRPVRTKITSLFGLRASNPARSFKSIASDLAIIGLKSGHQLYVDPLDTIVSRRLIESGHWEFWTTAAVLSLIRPGHHVVEVGANLGYYTVLMADRVGSTGSVLAMEANPRLSAMANDSLVLNGLDGHALVLNLAALDRRGSISFVTSPTNAGAGHVAILAKAPFADAVTITVQATTLDDVVTENVNFIRLDAEGCEPQILRGAQEILKRNHDVIVCFEWSLVQIESRTSAADFLKWMSELGFSFWLIERDARLVPITVTAIMNLPHTDLVAARGDPRANQSRV